MPRRRTCLGTWLGLVALALAACATAAPAPTPSVAPSAAALAPPVPAPAPPPAPPPRLRIAFGSCSDLKKPARLWSAIAAQRPDAFVWLGDIVYADTENMLEMTGLYQELYAHPEYAALRGATRVLGTWDDHDYGRNDAGREYPMRAEAQQVLLDFLDEPKDSPRRTQAGVYAAYDFGSPPYQVRVILLDTRYHRDPIGAQGDVLGAEQWAWLERQLRDSPAAVHVIGSSIQALADEHPHERWGNFPAARARLLALIDQSGARNPVIVSGDRHFAELTREALPSGRLLYDLTSSSLSRPFPRPPDSPNTKRVGEVFWDVNFGVVEIAFDTSPPRLALEVHSDQGRKPLAFEFPLEFGAALAAEHDGVARGAAPE